MTTNTKTLIQTILAFAMTNNITAIWRMKITIEMLEAELGKINERGRKDLAVVERYITGRGAKAHEAVAALQRLDPMADQSAPQKRLAPSLRANTLGIQLKSHGLLQERQRREQQRRERLAHRYEELTECSSRDVTPEEQLATIKEIEGKLDKRSRRAA